MAWSEWMQDGPIADPDRCVGRYEGEEYQFFAGALYDGMPPLSPPNITTWVLDYDNAHTHAHVLLTYSGVWEDPQRNMLLLEPPSDWETWRPGGWPAGIADLVPGVDIGQDPDGNWFQWEDGPNAIAGWNIPDLMVEWHQSKNVGGVDPGPWTYMQVELHTNLPDVGYGGIPDFPAEGTGIVLGHYADADMASLVLPVPDPGPVSSVAVVAHVPDLFDPVVYPYPGSLYGGGGHYTVLNGWAVLPWETPPTVTVQLPRYRYWVIDTATRLFPRDDGLGLSSAPRLFPPPKSRRVVGGYQ